jgi:hypothetical protein
MRTLLSEADDDLFPPVSEPTDGGKDRVLLSPSTKDKMGE